MRHRWIRTAKSTAALVSLGHTLGHTLCHTLCPTLGPSAAPCRHHTLPPPHPVDTTPSALLPHRSRLWQVSLVEKHRLIPTLCPSPQPQP